MMKVICFRGLAFLLIVTLLSGCATRTIHFSSNPEGALVNAGGASCTTPCDLQVPDKTPSALFTLSSGARKEIPIGDLTSRAAATSYALGRTGEYAIGSLAVPFLLGGGAIFLLGCLLDASDCLDGGGDNIALGGEDNGIAEKLELVGLISMAAGGVLYVVGARIGDETRDVRPEVRASFIQTPLLPAQELVPPPRKNADGTVQLFPETDTKRR